MFCHHVPFAQGPGASLWGWAKLISLPRLRKSWKPWLSLYSRIDPVELTLASQTFTGHMACPEHTGQDLGGPRAFDDLFIMYLLTLCN